MQGLSDRYRSGLVALISFLASFGVYLPGALKRSAWSDDISLLENDEFSLSFAVGRPVYGYAYRAFFPDTVDGLVLLRLIGVAGIATLAAIMAVCLSGWGVSKLRSILWAIATVMLPAFHSFAGWAAAFLMPWAGVLGLLSGIMWCRNSVTKSIHWHLAAVVMMIVSFLTYPPTALCCWVYLGLRTIVLRPRPYLLAKQIFSMANLTLVSGAAFLIIAEAFRKAQTIPVSSRFEIVNSVPIAIDKVIWFVTHPVVVVARPFNIDSPTNTVALLTGGPVLLIVGIGLFMHIKGGVWERSIFVCLNCVIFSFTMLTHLVGMENQIEFRFLAGASILMFAYLCISLVKSSLFILSLTCMTISRTISSMKIISSCLLVVLLPIVSLLAVRNIDQVFISPYGTKELFIQDELADFDPTTYSTIVVINDPSHYPVRKHLGVYSTVTDLGHGWVPAPMIRLVLREHYGIDQMIEVKVRSDRPSIIYASEYLVDLRPYTDSIN